MAISILINMLIALLGVAYNELCREHLMLGLSSECVRLCKALFFQVGHLHKLAND